MSRDILLEARACLKSSDVIETLLFEGMGSFSNGKIVPLPILSVFVFVGDFFSWSSSNFDMVLNGNCIRLHVHRTRMVIISFWDWWTKASFKRSKNSIISAHIARLTRRSWDRESFDMPCAVGRSQRPRIIINIVVCSTRSDHLSCDRSRLELDWKQA